jgi:hypothetical protein
MPLFVAMRSSLCRLKCAYPRESRLTEESNGCGLDGGFSFLEDHFGVFVGEDAFGEEEIHEALHRSASFDSRGAGIAAAAVCGRRVRRADGGGGSGVSGLGESAEPFFERGAMFGRGFNEGDAHAKAGVRIDDLAGQLNQHFIFVEAELDFGTDGQRSESVNVAAAQAQIGGARGEACSGSRVNDLHDGRDGVARGAAPFIMRDRAGLQARSFESRKFLHVVSHPSNEAA